MSGYIHEKYYAKVSTPVCGIHLKRHSSRCYRGRTEREIFHTMLYCRTRYTQSLCDLCNGVGTLSIVPINCWRIYTRTTTEVVFTAMAEPIRHSISCAFTYHIFWSTMGALFFRVWSLIILWDTTYAWLTVCYSTPQEHIWPLSPIFCHYSAPGLSLSRHYSILRGKKTGCPAPRPNTPF